MTAPPQARRALTIVTVAMLVTVLLTAGGWWLTHAEALPPSGTDALRPQVSRAASAGASSRSMSSREALASGSSSIR